MNFLFKLLNIFGIETGAGEGGGSFELLALVAGAFPYVFYILAVVFGGELVTRLSVTLQALFAARTIRKRRFIFLWAVVWGLVAWLFLDARADILGACLLFSNHFYDRIKEIQPEDVLAFVERYVLPFLPGAGGYTRPQAPGGGIPPGELGNYLAGLRKGE